MIEAILIVVIFLLLSRGGLASLSLNAGGNITTSPDGTASVQGFAFLGPNSDPSKWYMGTKPGTVYVGGQPGGADWQPSHTAQTGLAVAGQGLGAAEGISQAATGGALGAGTALGTALPIIGIGIGIVGSILGMISAHHQQALANEGKHLNDADPRAMQAMALVLQGVLNGEIADAATAQHHLDQIKSDWLGEVSTIKRGNWPYTGQDMSADYQKVWIARTQPPKGAPGYSDYHAPDPCNGACVIDHLFIERDEFLVMAAVSDALKGNHGVLVLPEIPPHATQSGVPQIQVIY